MGLLTGCTARMRSCLAQRAAQKGPARGKRRCRLPAVTPPIRFPPRLCGSSSVLCRDPDLPLRVSMEHFHSSNDTTGRGSRGSAGKGAALLGLLSWARQQYGNKSPALWFCYPSSSLLGCKHPKLLHSWASQGVSIFISVRHISAFLSQKAPCILIMFLSFFIPTDLVLMVISLEKHAF